VNPFPGLTNEPDITPFPAATPAGVDRTTDAAREVVLKVADMLDGLETTEIAVPRSEWTVGEQGAHIAFANIGFGMFAMGLDYPHGDGTRDGLAEANDVALIGFPERDGTALAEHLRIGITNFMRAVDAGSIHQECPSPLGTMPLSTLTSYFLIHNLMHGCAIASGLVEDFPFKPSHLEMIWPLVIHAFPSFVNPSASQGVSGSAQMVVGDFEAVFRMENGELSVLPGDTAPVDCVVEAEPTHFFLTLIKILTVQEAIELGYMKVSGTNPDLFGRIMNALDIP
jgi:hypothetical protein